LKNAYLCASQDLISVELKANWIPSLFGYFSFIIPGTRMHSCTESDHLHSNFELLQLS